MGQLGHIICLVELGGIDLVDLVGVHFSLLLEMSVDHNIDSPRAKSPHLSILTLDKQPAAVQFFQY